MIPRILCMLALFTLPFAAFGNDADTLFNEGNKLYASGDYEQAVETYQQALAIQQSANAHYNLANAYYQLGDYGPAVLHYEKALALEPRNPDYQANLELTQEAAQLTPAAPAWPLVIAKLTNVNVWAWLAVVSFWATFALLLLAPMYRWKGPLRGGLTVLSILLLAVSSVALYGWHVRGSYGVVLTDDATLNVAPTSSSPPAGAVTAGQVARIRERHGDFYLITLDDKVGWLNKEAFAPIWDQRS